MEGRMKTLERDLKEIKITTAITTNLATICEK
jgi:hypothetical protein